MIVNVLVVGPIGANCIIVGCEKTKKAVVVDPGDEGDRILTALSREKLVVEHIVNTHGHFDHVGANKRLKEVTGADILIHKDDAMMLGHLKDMALAFGMHIENSPPADKLLIDGDEITFGECSLKVLHTPGHSPGGVSLLGDDFVIAGDTLFQGSIGRTDLPGGDFKTLINSIKTKLFTLPDNTKVYTGHGPATLIGGEKRFNPFLH